MLAAVEGVFVVTAHQTLSHEALAALDECEPRRGRTWGTAQWSIVHIPTGEIVPALPKPIDTLDGVVMPGLGPRFFRLKRDAAAALTELRTRWSAER